jgi:L-cysteine S-thiosulfotransferase
MMKTKCVFAGMALAAAVASLGCAPDTKSGRGFHMPGGDVTRGKVAFVQLGCTECHRVSGIELGAGHATPRVVVHLGGDVSRRRTYGDLVTAIIHPSRDRSDLVTSSTEEGPLLEMRDFTREMTVAQLMDVVTFLEPTYRQAVPALYISP